jgi:hypothetical protein
MLTLPPRLSSLPTIDGQVGLRVVIDFTIYLKGPSEGDLDALWDLYEAVCPKGRRVSFKIDELLLWSPIANPELTQSAREALASGRKRPYFEATRRRVRSRRSFTSRIWDGREIGDPDGSWSFTCAGLRRRASGLHSFARFLVPLSTELDVVERLALEVADKFEFRSGHGGLVFTYDPELEGPAFDQIYGLAKRFWGVDIDDMDQTLPLAEKHIKGVNWITAVGSEFARKVAYRIERLAMTPDLKVRRAAKGVVIVAGAAPNPGDQNTAPGGPADYRRVAEALAPLFMASHPDFPSERFMGSGSTSGWIRRFIDPGAW